MLISFFDKELHRLRESLVRMGHLVEGMLDDALLALKSNDVDLAEQTIIFDNEINALENSIVNKTILLIATNQPVAGDLRFLAASIRLAGELERIADLSANVARRAKGMAELDPNKSMPHDLGELAAATSNMLRCGFKAFVEKDVSGAGLILDMDKDIDELNRRVRTQMMAAIAANGELIYWGLEVINAAANLERLADHVTNVAEDVIYIYSGHNVRHGGREVVPELAANHCKMAMVGAVLAGGNRDDREDLED